MLTTQHITACLVYGVMLSDAIADSLSHLELSDRVRNASHMALLTIGVRMALMQSTEPQNDPDALMAIRKRALLGISYIIDDIAARYAKQTGTDTDTVN